MLRSIGSVTFLALLMVGCGGGGGELGSPPPPPPPNGYTIHGTVSGLQGSGLVLQIVEPGTRGHPEHPGHKVGPPVPITSNGPFTIVEGPPTVSSGLVAVISQQPASPSQPCLVHNAINFQAGNVTDIEVGCSQFAYVANAGDNTVSAYTIDATTGALTALPGFPVGAGTSPLAIVGTDDRTYVFVGNEGSNDISAFAVNFASGALTPVPGSPFAAGTDPQGMALYGSTLYVANAGSDTVSAYTIDYSTGALTTLPGSPVPVGKNPTSIVVDPITGVVFVANHGGSNDISAFYFRPDPSARVAVSRWRQPAQPGVRGRRQLSLHGKPRCHEPKRIGLQFRPGYLDIVAAQRVPIPAAGEPLHGHRTNRNPLFGSNSTSGYLYVTTDANIVGYAIDWTTGALTALPGFPVAAGANAYSVHILRNQFLYVANDGAANITGFRLDVLTGALTPMAGSPFPAGNHPKFIATF